MNGVITVRANFVEVREVMRPVWTFFYEGFVGRQSAVTKRLYNLGPGNAKERVVIWEARSGVGSRRGLSSLSENCLQIGGMAFHFPQSMGLSFAFQL